MTPCIDLLLVDDEQIAREGLRRIIDWEALGYRICAEAGNGEEALEKIRLYQPGLVLLDIRLPGINGTEVIRKAREMGFTGEVIFLTAYSDFAYTQQAIRYGASGYLIKPIDTIELQSLVLAARTRIEASDSNRLRLNQYRSKTREKVLFDLLTGAGFDPAVNYYELGLSAPGYQVVIYESYSPFFHQNDFAGLLMSGTEDGGDGQLRGIEQLQLDQQQVLLLMSPAAISRFQAWIGHLQESFEKNSYMDSIFFVYGEVVPQLQDIGRSYHQCQDLIRRRFFCSENQHMLSYQDLPARNQPRQPADEALCARLSQLTYEYLQLRQPERICGALNTLGKLLYENDLAGLPGKHILIDYFLQIKQKVISAHGEGMAELFDSNSAIINLIESRNFLYEIVAYFKQQFTQIMERIGVSSSDNVIHNLLQYVQANYSSKLTLEQLAGQFGYNSSYLGRLFAEKQGCSFSHYLETFRIEQARQLLTQSSLKIYEIAEKTGFKYTDVFTAKFKKYIGCTPQQYRRRLESLSTRGNENQPADLAP